MKSKILVAMFFVILFMGLVSSADWDNVKDYDEENKEITIVNILGLGKDIAKYKLEYNTDYCLIECYAEGKVTLYEEGALFTEMNFLDKKGSTINIEGHDIYYEDKRPIDLPIPTYEEVCRDLANGTYCSMEQNGTTESEEQEKYWKKYNGEIMPKGSYKWRLEGTKKRWESVDWVGSAFGVDLNEWAWWNTDYTFKRNITGLYENIILPINATSTITINSTETLIYGTGGVEPSLYYNNNTLTAIANDTDEFFKAQSRGWGDLEKYSSSGVAPDNLTFFMPFDNNITGSAVEFVSGTLGTFNDSADHTQGLEFGGSRLWGGWSNLIKEGSGFVEFSGSGQPHQGDIGTIMLYMQMADGCAESKNIVYTMGGNWRYSIETEGDGNDVFKMRVGGTVASTSCTGWWSAGDWILLTATWDTDADEQKAYVNKILKMDLAVATTPESVSPFSIGAGIGGSGGSGANITHVIAYDRVLSITEIGYVYDMVTALEGEEEVVIPSPNVTLNIPTDDTNFSVQSVTFNCSSDTAEGIAGVLNLSLLIDDVINYTIYNTTERQNLSLETSLDFPDESYNWSCSSEGTGDSLATSEKRRFLIDTVDPEVHIFYPLANIVTSSVPRNVDFNISVTDINTADCIYYNGTANNTVACGTNVTLALGEGSHTLIYYANDSSGNLGFNSTTFILNYVYENATYLTPDIEGEISPISLNLTASSITSFNGTLYYNNFSQITTYSNLSDVITFNTSFIPNETGNNSFYVQYYLDDVLYNSSTYFQLINPISNLNISTGACPTGLSQAMHFDFKSETNRSNITSSVNYIFRYGVTNSTFKTTTGNLTTIDQFNLCINSTVSNNYTLGYGEIQYYKEGYSDRRFYTFNTQRLSNSTINNTLYDLINADATSFLFDFKNTDLTPYVGAYTSLLRWYPELDQYLIVEMGKTDDKGETIMRVKVEDVDYRVGVYYANGTLIQLLNPVRFACLSAPCSYSTQVSSTVDYTSFFDVQTSITFNTTTNLWRLVWSDATQNTNSMRFKVVRERGDGYYTICDDTASGFTGVITCDSTGYTGTIRGSAYRTASPEIPIDQKVISTANTPFKSSVGLFLAFILLSLLMLIGIFSPVASVIFGIIALVPAFFMGSITLEIFIGIAVLGGIIIHFMKRTG